MKIRFPVRPRPRESESLASHLVRVSKMNGYIDPFDSRRVWREYMDALGCGHDNPIMPLCKDTARIYCELLDVAPFTFLSMTAHRFAVGMLHPSDVVQQKIENTSASDKVQLWLQMTPSQLSHHLRLDNRAAYCPFCLCKAVYHRIDWQPRVIGMCAEHRCYLRETCPDCSAFVGVADVAWGCCRKCGGRLASATQALIDPASLEYKSQAVLRGWLTRDGSEDDLGIVADTMAEPLNALYYLVLGLRTSLMSDTRILNALGFGLGENTPLRIDHRTASPETNARVLAAAYNALLDWPSRFHRFLDAIRQVNDASDADSVRAFKYLYSRHLSHDWKIVPFSFVQQAFESYMVADPSLCASFLKSKRNAGSAKFLETLPYVTLDAASKILGISAKRLGDLMRDGVLKQYNNSQSAFIMVSRAEVEALRKKWSELLTLMETTIRLGISHDSIIGLAEEGLLEGGRGIGPGNSENWEFTTSSVEALVRRVSAHIEVRSPDQAEGGIDLVQTVQRASVYGMTLSRVVKAIVEGEMSAFVAAPDWRLDDLRVQEEEIDRFTEGLRERLGWVTREEFARRMGVKRNTITKWVASGLVVRTDATAKARFFERDDVERFVAEHVFSREAASILGIAVHTVTQWALRGRLHPVSGPGVDDCHRFLFRRSECWMLRPENRLSSPQTAELLGVNLKTFMKWIEQRKVKSISGPGIDGTETYVFLRSEIDVVSHS